MRAKYRSAFWLFLVSALQKRCYSFNIEWFSQNAFSVFHYLNVEPAGILLMVPFLIQIPMEVMLSLACADAMCRAIGDRASSQQQSCLPTMAAVALYCSLLIERCLTLLPIELNRFALRS